MLLQYRLRLPSRQSHERKVKRKNNRDSPTLFGAQGPFPLLLGFWRTFSCLCCCPLSCHIVLWLWPLMGEKKGEKKNLDCPSHSSICRGLLSRSSNQKERVLSEFLPAPSAQFWTQANSGKRERERKKKQKCTPKWVPFSSFGCSLGFTCYCLSFRVRSCFLCFEHSLEIGGSRFTLSWPSW